MSTSSRDTILLRIKQALAKPVPVPFPQQIKQEPVFHAAPDELDLLFAENFTKLQGRFSFCENEKELASQLNMLFIKREWSHLYCREDELKQTLATAGFHAITATDVASCDAAITSCEFLVARTGSMVMSSAQQSGRTVSVYAPVHICIAYTNQLVYDIDEALIALREEYAEQLPSMVTLATGPSRTADIEKTLVVGVHGPKEVFCFLVQRS